MNDAEPRTFDVSRREFLAYGAFTFAGSATRSPLLAEGDQQQSPLRIGLLTDLHYAEKAPAGTRHYRETLDKLEEAAERLESAAPEFIVELGDLIDSADTVGAELGHLRRINKDFTAICKQRHYVLGNHCVHTLTKAEFLETVEKKRSYYSFDVGGVHFVVLDSCFRSDGEPYGRKNFVWTDPNIPQDELDWLADDLGKSNRPTIVFAHQRLDVAGNHGVNNAPAVRKILERSGRVRAVFQGHSHRNDLKQIAGIPYCTLVAMVEGSGADNNGYSLLEIASDGTLRLDGFRKQRDYEWSAR